MYMIIVGGGGVGTELARSFSEKDFDIVVIEKNPEQARRLGEIFDVMVIEENGAGAPALERAGVKTADMVIAVTETDEINIIACMIAKRYGVPVTVARVRNADYAFDSAVLTREQLGIDLMISPERSAAYEISRMLHFPEACEVEYFSRGRVMMLSLIAGPETDIVRKPFHKLNLPPGCIIVGINEGQGKFTIPGGEDTIKPGSRIYLLGQSRALKDISRLLLNEHTLINRVTIIGGGKIGFELARLLEESRSPFQVNLVERDGARCERISRELSQTLILQGDGLDLDLFRQEEMEQVDAVVAVSGDDRTNVIAGVLARQAGIKKIICEVADPQFAPVYNALGLNSIINPRLITASQILRFARREDLISLSILNDERAEVLELVLSDSAPVLRKKVAEAGFPRGMLIGALIRGQEVLIPRGQTRLLPGDHLIIFTLPEISGQLERFFAPRGNRTHNSRPRK
ncbi:MAG: Trk system potassium transporter TrkA [Firmicutes bacterium]|nr:Trk system potassium transporter TrkA [Bacillota bacterium]